MMDLREYLFRNRISVAEFSRKIDYHRNYVNQIALGHKTPSRKLAKAIELETAGQVTIAELMSPKKEEEHE